MHSGNGVHGQPQVTLGAIFWLRPGHSRLDLPQKPQKKNEMITQNPIIGKARKKLGNVYARTLYGINIIQSCPKPSTKPMSPKRLACQTAFRYVTEMANQLPASLLNNLYYSAPVGKSRRSVLISQLMKAVVRNDTEINYNAQLVSALGGNPIALKTPNIVQFTDTNITIQVDDVDVSPLAELSMLPCVIALSYDLHVAYNLLPLSSIENDTVSIGPVPSNWVGHEFYLYPLFPVNVNTLANPIYAFGRFDSSSTTICGSKQ